MLVLMSSLHELEAVRDLMKEGRMSAIIVPLGKTKVSVDSHHKTKYHVKGKDRQR